MLLLLPCPPPRNPSSGGSFLYILPRFLYWFILLAALISSHITQSCSVLFTCNSHHSFLGSHPSFLQSCPPPNSVYLSFVNFAHLCLRVQQVPAWSIHNRLEEKGTYNFHIIRDRNCSSKNYRVEKKKKKSSFFQTQSAKCLESLFTANILLNCVACNDSFVNHPELRENEHTVCVPLGWRIQMIIILHDYKPPIFHSKLLSSEIYFSWADTNQSCPQSWFLNSVHGYHSFPPLFIYSNTQMCLQNLAYRSGSFSKHHTYYTLGLVSITFYTFPNTSAQSALGIHKALVPGPPPPTPANLQKLKTPT